ncbi:MAG TPA: hypothetical protein VGA99_12330 [bacterium]
MKIAIVTLILLTWVATGFGQPYDGSSFTTQSYYGFSGLTFIPTAQTHSPGQWSISYISKPSAGKDLTLEPFSFSLSYSPKMNGLELAVTNTPLYASTRQFGGVAIDTGLPELVTPAPIFPSVKYQFMPMVEQNFNVAMAIGFGLPYGAYYVVDKFFDAKLFDITVHTGVGTKLTTYHAFGGATFTFGQRSGEVNRDFPLEMLVEGSWGGSLKQLAEKEEAFLAVSFRLAWTSSLFMTTFFRIDDQPFLDDSVMQPSPTKRVGLGLSYIWR